MSECMIIRRGGGGSSGGGGFDPTGAILKVVTSTGCAVSITNGNYNETHADSEGFVRPSDAAVTEHFFSIPASAFGTFTVVSTNTYGTNSKTITVNTAGKVYELLCGGINIILDSTFGLQGGFVIAYSGCTYSDRYKNIQITTRPNKVLLFGSTIPVAAFNYLTVGVQRSGSSCYLELEDADKVSLATCHFSEGDGDGYVQEHTAQIKDKYYPTAYMYMAYDIRYINKIVLS